MRGAVTAATLKRVLDHYARSGWRADHIQATGDIVQDDSHEAYLRFRDLLTPVELPVYCVPGNHDVRPLMQELLSGEPFHYCAALQRGNWLAVGIDSCMDGNPAGRVDDGELERLERLMKKSPADHVMVCLHHPPLPVGSKWLDELGVQNSERLRARLSSDGRVRLLLFGHVHQAFDEVYQSMRIIGTPSTCRQFAPGSESFSLDDKPPAYRCVSLHPDGRVETDLVWT